MKTVRDAVHGDIALGGLAMEVVDTVPFQRLRGIKQLGTSSLVYPSATHTRFEHSLGTAWMTGRMLDVLRRTAGDPGLLAGAEQALLLAALLHDIGHVPFGHTFEDERALLPRHDADGARFRALVEESGIGRILAREGLLAEVRDLLRPPAGGAAGAREIVCGDICADLLDYLKRDAFFCGLRLDYDERVLATLRYDPAAGLHFDLQKRGQLRADALSELLNLLRMRYTLTERVYYHHAKAASGAMVSKALELALAGGALRPEELWHLRDDELLWLLATRCRAAAPLVEDLRGHRIGKAVYELRPADRFAEGLGEAEELELCRLYHADDGGRRSALEDGLAGSLGLAPGEVIVSCPAAGMSLKEARVQVRATPGRLERLDRLDLPELRVLLDKHRSLWRFRVLMRRCRMDLAPRAAALCEERLGHRNML